MPTARWSLLSKIASKARSSHSLGITHDGLLLLYGGELEPRKPVDTSVNNSANHESLVLKGSVHSFGLKHQLPKTNNPWVVLVPKSNSVVPEPRVGATTVWDESTESLYLWGGRGGVDMAPLDRGQAGLWKGHIDQTSPSSIEWERLIASNEDDSPEPRSYHAAVSSEGKVYIHAGCPASGRLSTLHSFNIATKTWRSLAPAPDPARGGTSLAVVLLHDDEGPVILRFAGFAGYELGADHTLDIYTISTNTWHTVLPAADQRYGYPGARSVHGLVPFQSKFNSAAIALLYYGERGASTIGHVGAGTFWDDVWLLEYHKSGEDGNLSWKKVDIAEGGMKPEGRGWIPSASYVDEGGETKVVMFGGLLSSNERSDELWVLAIE